MSSIQPFLRDRTIGMTAEVPKTQLLNQSVKIESDKILFLSWGKEHHACSYQFMQRITQTWKKNNITDQFMVFGKLDNQIFNWEVIPYQKCSGVFGAIKRVIQQIVVLWRIVFVGVSVSDANRKQQTDKYKAWLMPSPNDPAAFEEDAPITKKVVDPFCNKIVIDRQVVITGNKVNLLLSRGPIGFGGERLHFLAVPKEHRENFTDLTEEEYCESMELTQMLDAELRINRDIKNVYMFHKTGKDAGTTIPHWMLHVIFTSNKVQDLWGKLTVFKNILLGSSFMNDKAYDAQVAKLRDEFKGLQVRATMLSVQ